MGCLVHIASYPCYCLASRFLLMHTTYMYILASCIRPVKARKMLTLKRFQFLGMTTMEYRDQIKPWNIKSQELLFETINKPRYGSTVECTIYCRHLLCCHALELNLQGNSFQYGNFTLFSIRSWICSEFKSVMECKMSDENSITSS